MIGTTITPTYNDLQYIAGSWSNFQCNTIRHSRLCPPMGFSVLICILNLLNLLKYFATSICKNVIQVVISTGVINLLHRFIFPF